tara:strand:- start:150 stop:281 length:132 start_codon:yes stop_codon:yes gene_type:complete
MKNIHTSLLLLRQNVVIENSIKRKNALKLKAFKTCVGIKGTEE